ncbi:hypothetical protein SODALDRAFT_277974 [Sodiomyces alkalinus F11]|uniref:Zn(2)-C6 fungal-type domain-containing protein n=1 Tax=Sodiomyces alkalinus (strain CBS 110278 / VKM F-3762 / F11) TaxID=1314773 RepID=A0A3N2PV37_SODAK|nr:hypothetical protein SODALDRAFT_277974 [Sodiomyces alkalinus F11]ROT38355.1 hypothetical protein SODALDRAFT_277974 [Sodiomyces alkalinus F11]
MLWDQGSDDALAMPKLEPLDDDFSLDDVKETPTLHDDAHGPSPTHRKPKRPRGRPRKHPQTSAVNTGKVTKGRSKTGCITCRKRKKKCDEAKPRCMNCEKNAVLCEGYHEKKLWKSGKEKASDGTNYQGNEDSLVFNMQPLFHGVVTVEDRIFWKHYCVSLSNVLTVEGEARNAFKDIILPLANQHQGVMHSILAMSSKHIDYDTPYGIKLLRQNPTTGREALQTRSQYHHKQALESFHADIRRSGDEEEVDHRTILCARYAQILCLLIGTLIEGNPHGEHRVHLRGYQRLIQQTPPEDPTFLAFITEFFQYHIFADELLWHPGMNFPRLSDHDWAPHTVIESPRLLGVGDGLFQHLTDIATIKDTIRRNIHLGSETRVDYHLLWQAQEIQEAIEQWSPSWPAGDSRHRVGLVYKHMMFLHLFRAIYPPTTSGKLPWIPSNLITANMPVSPATSRRASQSSRPLTASSSSSSPSQGPPTTACAAPMAFQQHSPPGSRNPSRTSSTHESDQTQCSVNNSTSLEQSPASPAPIRRPPHHDARITAAVEESLTLMEGFKPFDPALTLLLVPCQILGVACFEQAQQSRVIAVIRQVRGYTGLRNCDRVLELLEEVWRLMEEGDWYSVWDWQSIALKMGADYLCT